MTLDLRYPSQPSSTPWPAAEWPRGPLPASTDKAKLDGLLAHAFSAEAQPAMGETHAFVAIQGGRIVAERYAGGQYTAASTYPSWSMAKSITQLLIGFLAAEETIDVDAPINAPEWQGEDDPRAMLSWTQLLHMSSGLEFVEDYIDGARSDVIEMLFASGKDDVASYAAGKPLAHAPDTVFNYASGTSNILARALGLKVGRRRDNVKAFMQARLFGPLGVTGAIPKFDEKGTFIGSSYCFMRAEDFARIGLLALRGGMWDGQRLLPQSWIDFARTPGPVQPEDKDRGYGAHWWLEMFSPGGFSMNGYAGQWVACCPDRDLIIVRHGDSVNEATAQRQEAAYQWVKQAMSCFGA
jgi:CubicO group peptidase (beta-lactamase class C family)